MTYTGDVNVGGPADTRELGRPDDHQAGRRADGQQRLPAACRSTGEALLIDAANEADRLLDAGRRRAARPRSSPRTGTATTGRRCAEVVEATGARTVAHELDAPELPVPVDRDRSGTATPCRSATCGLTVIHLRGHTPGSIALAYPTRRTGSSHLFTGDSLFPGGPGQHQQDPQRFGSLMDDLEARVFGRYGDSTWVYPGHGKDTSLGAERPSVRSGAPAAGDRGRRAARPAEAAAICALALRSKAHWGYDPAFLEACRDDLTIGRSWCDGVRLVVAEQDGVLLGYARVARRAAGRRARRAVRRPGRDRARRRRGAAAAGRPIAAGLGMTALEIESDPNAEPFYRHAGAVRTGESASTVDPTRLLPRLELAVPA